MNIREISVKEITDIVAELCISSNKVLPKMLEQCIADCAQKEKSPLGTDIFYDMIDNLSAAKKLDVPICQDTGMAVVFVEVGQDVHLVGGDLVTAINDGVKKGYIDGMLRLSIVADPLERVNTNSNTPAVIHQSIVAGDKVKITVAPKGFGSENMSGIQMFTPSASKDDIIDFVVDTVSKAGSNPCPPIVVGVGIGGDFELCAYLAKKALCRDVATRNSDKNYQQLESTMLEKINELGIGPQGFGGTVTALAVNIEIYATHIAGLPVAVNMGCHVTRHKTAVL